MNEVDRLLEEIFRNSKGAPDDGGRRTLRGFLGQLSDLAALVAENEALVRGMGRDRGINIGDLPGAEEDSGDLMYRCLHDSTVAAQQFKVYLLAYWTDKRGGV